MFADSPRRPPYIDWSLDRWKFGAVLALFVGLVAASLAAPAPDEVATTSPASGLINPTPPAAFVSSAAPVVVPESSVPATQAPEVQLPIPLTLATLGPNAIVPANSVRQLGGTALPGAWVEVRTVVREGVVSEGVVSEGVETRLGRAQADRQGLWQVVLESPLPPGKHMLALHELDGRDQSRIVSDPIEIEVLSPGAQGPPALTVPQIRTPSTGARLATGRVGVTGVGLPGFVVQLYLNDEHVADGMVSAQDEWTMSPEVELAPGVYVARVMTLNPQGDRLAESAPVVFVVEEHADRSSLPYPLPNPSLPLTVSGLAFSDRRRTTLLVHGLATPQIAVVAWLDGLPMQQTQAALDGSWQVALENPAGFGGRDVVQIRSSLGEQVRTDLTRQAPVVQRVDGTPRLISPQAGAVLTSPQPLLTGAAQPGAVVAVLVNEQLVAEVTADAQGQWAFQLDAPLPAGIVALAVGPGREPRPERLAAPVVVTIAPEL
jgi:hypothetical protein